jgi:Uma2 family endonuclease
MGTKTLLTLAEYEKLQEPEGVRRYELDEGELVELSFSSPKHNRVARQAFVLLHAFVREHRLGEVYLPDMPYLLFENPPTLRGPDVSFLRTERAREIDPEGYVHGAPDLAIEVVSPSDRATDLNRRVEQFLAAGAQTVCVLFPETRQAHVHTKDAVRKLKTGDVLDFPGLLPGFAVPVVALFES